MIGFKAGTGQITGQIKLKEPLVGIGSHKILLKDTVDGRTTAGHRSVDRSKFIHLILQVPRHMNARKDRLLQVVGEHVLPLINFFFGQYLLDIKIRLRVGNTVLVSLGGAALLIGIARHNPVVGLDIKLLNFMANPFGNAGFSLLSPT